MTAPEEFEPDGLALIVKGPGTTFEHQSGGYACYHPKVMGWPITISEDSVLDKLLLAYCEEVHGGRMVRVNETDADRLDEILAPLRLKIDRRSLGDASIRSNYRDDQSCEAFLHVLSDEHGECVLLWPNSD